MNNINDLITTKGTELARAVAPYVSQVKNLVSPLLNRAVSVISPLVSQAQNAVAPYATKAIEIATPYFNQMQAVATTYSQKAAELVAPYVNVAELTAPVAQYVKTHSVTSIFCAAVATEAAFRGSVNLVKGLANLTVAGAKYGRELSIHYKIQKKLAEAESEEFIDEENREVLYKTLKESKCRIDDVYYDHLKTGLNQLKEAAKDAAYATAYGIGAINPVAGIAVPLISMVASQALWQRNSASGRYTTAAIVQKLPEKILETVSKITAFIVFIPTKIVSAVTKVVLRACSAPNFLPKLVGRTQKIVSSPHLHAVALGSVVALGVFSAAIV